MHYPGDILRFMKVSAPALLPLLRSQAQGEILAILESAAVEGVSRRSVAETLEYVRSLGVRTPAESVDMIRADRDGR